MHDIFFALILVALGMILNLFWGKWGEVFQLLSGPPVIVSSSLHTDTKMTICCRNLCLESGMLG